MPVSTTYLNVNVLQPLSARNTFKLAGCFVTDISSDKDELPEATEDLKNKAATFGVKPGDLYYPGHEFAKTTKTYVFINSGCTTAAESPLYSEALAARSAERAARSALKACSGEVRAHTADN